ncbi:MAG: cold shock domain-containing protein [Nitrospira sp.]|nr:cold shock domain-containing protein [Nitrospira sp.]
MLREGGGEVYFHANALQGLTFEGLDDGTEVVFGLEDGKKGPQATVVSLPPPMASKAL